MHIIFCVSSLLCCVVFAEWWTSFLETDDGDHISICSPSSLLAPGPSDSHLCRQWPINVRDPGVPVLCVRGVSACHLADHRQAGNVAASGCVLVCRLWFHPRCHWGLVHTVLWYYSRGPELPVTAVWVQNEKNVFRKVCKLWWCSLEVLFQSTCFVLFSHRERILQRWQSICDVSSSLHRTMLNFGIKKEAVINCPCIFLFYLVLITSLSAWRLWLRGCGDLSAFGLCLPS